MRLQNRGGVAVIFGDGLLVGSEVLCPGWGRANERVGTMRQGRRGFGVKKGCFGFGSER